MSGLILLAVLPFVPGVAPLMRAASMVVLGAAVLFALDGTPGDAALAVEVALFVELIRRFRLFRVARCII